MSYQFIDLKQPVDINDNFWKQNSQLRYIEPFKDLYDRDSSKDKSVSSKECISIWFLKDPNYYNKVYRLPEDQKKSTVLYFFPEFDFEDEVIKKCLSVYDELILTPAAKAFKAEEESLIKRAKFLSETEYTMPTRALDEKGKPIYIAGKPVYEPGTAKDLDTMRKYTETIIKQYEKAKKVFEEEQKQQSRIMGGGNETAFDRGHLKLIEDE